MPTGHKWSGGYTISFSIPTELYEKLEELRKKNKKFRRSRLICGLLRLFFEGRLPSGYAAIKSAKDF